MQQLEYKINRKKSGSFSMDIYKRQARFAVAVIQRKKMELKDKYSSISLSVPEGIEGMVSQAIHTDMRIFTTSIPKWECFISPVVEVHCYQLNKTDKEAIAPYCLQIPHYLETSFQQIKVRCGDLNQNQPFEEIPHKNYVHSTTEMFFEADEKCIRVYSTHFCQIMCSSCKQTCSSFILALPFGTLQHFKYCTLMKVKVYLCSALYKIEDFRTVCHYSNCSCLIINDTFNVITHFFTETDE